MTLDRIPLEKYKWHQGEGSQWSFQGIALNPKEQALAFKLNEVIAYINGVEAAFGITLDADDLGGASSGCCKEKDSGLDKLVDIENSNPEYKEDQLKGNDV